MPYTVKYSTQPVDMGVRTMPDLSTFVDEKDVHDWGDVKAVVVIMPKIASGVITSRFFMPTTDPTLATDAGKSAQLDTALFADDMSPLIRRKSAIVSVRGHATVTARLTYTTADGDTRTIELPELTKTFKDNEETLDKTSFPQTQDALKAAIGTLYPDGYTLSNVALVGDTTATYPNNAPAAGTPETPVTWNSLVRYYYDGAVVEYTLNANVTSSTMPITGADGFWNITTLSALLAFVAAVPALAAFGGVRRRGARGRERRRR